MTAPSAGPCAPRVILLQTRHAGNIGAVARIMDNFGLSRLTLVNPTGRGHLEAVRMASGSERIMESARFAGSLEEALEESSLSFAVTRRNRKIAKHVHTPEQAAEIIASHKGGEVALVFGSEKLGMSTEQVRQCSSVISIPSEAAAPSLNLAQAVAVVLYAVTRHGVPAPAPQAGDESTAGQRRIMFSRLEEILEKSGYFRTAGRAQTMADIENIFGRRGLTGREVTLLLGMWRRIKAAVDK